MLHNTCVRRTITIRDFVERQSKTRSRLPQSPSHFMDNAFGDKRPDRELLNTGCTKTCHEGAVSSSNASWVASSNGPPEVLIDTAAVPILGRTPRGFAMQIPWEVPHIPDPPLLLRGSEPRWERQLNLPVQEGYFPAVLPVGPTGPNSPMGI
jgi:hypothetical protein